MPDGCTVDVHIPAELADHLGGSGPGLDRRAVEALALLGFRSGDVTRFELRELLGFETRFELDGYVKSRGAYEPATLADARRDMETLKRLGY